MRVRYDRSRSMSLAVMFSFLLLASCSTTPPSPSVSQTSRGDTKPYGSLTVATIFGTGYVDPQSANATGFSALGVFIFDSLTYRESDGKLKPGLAEKWEIAPDGMSQTYYIRKGVKFHDGSDLTATDVKFTMERMMAPEAIYPLDAQPWRDAVAKIELKDDYTLMLYTKQPLFFLPQGQLASAMTAVVPKKYIEEKGLDYFRRNPIGSGPWKFVRYEPGVFIELEAVDSHWRNVPKFRYLKVSNIIEEASKVAMLKTGELDLADVALDSVAGLNAAGVRTINYESNGYFWGYLFHDTARPGKDIVSDVRVRKALQLSINSREIADSMFQGRARPFALYGATTSSPYFDPNVLKPDPFDPEGAKKLLAEAGYPNGFDLKFWDVGGGGQLSQISEAVVGYFRKVGVRANLTGIDYAALYAKRRPRMLPEMYDSGYIYGSTKGGHKEFDSMVNVYHSTKGTWQMVKVPELDELLERVLRTADPAEQNRLALQAAILAQQARAELKVISVDANVALSAKVGEVPWLAAGSLAYETATHAK